MADDFWGNHYPSYFDNSGISLNKMCHVLQYSERVKAINQYVPECVLLDFSTARNGELLRLRTKHPVYSKFITATVVTMRWLDSIFGKNEK